RRRLRRRAGPVRAAVPEHGRGAHRDGRPVRGVGSGGCGRRRARARRPATGGGGGGGAMSAGDGARLRALVIQHEQPTPGGYVHQWLDERGADQDVYRIDEEARNPDPRDYDLVVSLGSEFAAFDDTIPWIERERRLLGTAAGADVPMLGVCFGGQLLARVLGGETFRSERSEIGWLPVRTD